MILQRLRGPSHRVSQRVRPPTPPQATGSSPAACLAAVIASTGRERGRTHSLSAILSRMCIERLLLVSEASNQASELVYYDYFCLNCTKSIGPEKWFAMPLATACVTGSSVLAQGPAPAGSRHEAFGMGSVQLTCAMGFSAAIKLVSMHAHRMMALEKMSRQCCQPACT